MWIVTNILKDWFENKFIPQAREYSTSLGFSEDAKIILVTDNCSAHPNTESHKMDNVFANFLPPNYTSLIQPLDQDI